MTYVQRRGLDRHGRTVVAFTLRPDDSKPGGIDIRREETNFLDTVAKALNLKTLRVVETGGNSFAAEREQWDDGNNVKAEAEKLAAEKGWAIAPDGDKYRRVVASPRPKRIFEIRPIKWLLEKGSIVICAGGGGIPTVYGADGKLQGVYPLPLTLLVGTEGHPLMSGTLISVMNFKADQFGLVRRCRDIPAPKPTTPIPG